MRMTILPLFAVLLLVQWSARAQEAKLEITNLVREIYLKGKYVRVSYDISLQNNGPVAARKYLHLVHANYTDTLMDLIAFTPSYSELPVARQPRDSRNAAAGFLVELPSGLEVGSKVQIKILELYKNRLSPKPQRLPLSSDEQKVEFVDNLFVFSAYPIRSQETVLTVPSIDRIEYYTERDSTKIPKSKSIKYGPLHGAFAEEELRIHFELAVPLIRFPYVERQIELSHLGTISIVEKYELKNDAAALEGEFNRIKYNSLTGYKQAGHIFRKLYTQLPRKAFNLYYRDVIGNVSTSTATRESTYVFFEIRPRFPVLGGWQTKWEQGYKLLNQYYTKYNKDDPELYIFNYTFGYAFKKIMANRYRLDVVLPPGAKEVNVYLPFKGEVREETMKSYLDVEGRRVIVIEKENMHSYYAKNFLVTYRLTSRSMYEKLILMIVAFMCFYLFIIVCSRVSFKLS